MACYAPESPPKESLMNIDRANELLQRYRYAVADTCQAKAIFNAHLTGPTEEYSAARAMLDKYLKVEMVALTACQEAMTECDCRDREFGRVEAVCQAQRERELDYAEGLGGEDV
jgi:hypothetical protein